jgi:hypothetical protein
LNNIARRVSLRNAVAERKVQLLAPLVDGGKFQAAFRQRRWNRGNPHPHSSPLSTMEKSIERCMQSLIAGITGGFGPLKTSLDSCFRPTISQDKCVSLYEM